jgi:hypothetical protein
MAVFGLIAPERRGQGAGSVWDGWGIGQQLLQQCQCSGSGGSVAAASSQPLPRNCSVHKKDVCGCKCKVG